MSTALIPLRCSFCGGTFTGSPRLIGRTCPLNGLSGSPDVVQCDPSELSGVDAPPDGEVSW